MKRCFFYFVTLLGFLTFIACSDDSEKTKSEPLPVKNINWKSGPGTITFTWEEPSGMDVSNVVIEYLNDKDETQSILVRGSICTQTIYALPNTETQEFKFTVFVGDIASDFVVVEANAVTTPFEEILKTIRCITNLEGGIDFEYSNRLGGEYVLGLEFKNVKNDTIRTSYVIDQIGDYSRFLKINGVINDTISFNVSDVYGNKSTSFKHHYVKLEEGYLDRSIWSIPVLSSEETEGIGNYPGGFAVALLDGNTATYWKSRFAKAPMVYPHWVVFDLKRVVEIDKAEIYRRVGWSDVKTIDIFGSNDLDSEEWTLINTHTMLSGKNMWQICAFEESVHYRYIRMYCRESFNMKTLTTACLSEFRLYGRDIVVDDKDDNEEL